MKKILLLLFLSTLFTACSGLNSGGYNNGYGNSGSRNRYDNRYDNRYGGRRYDDIERQRLENERERLELERLKLENERNRINRSKVIKVQPPKIGRCPSGWRRSDRKCTTSDRKKWGCKDMRTKAGTLCIQGRQR